MLALEFYILQGYVYVYNVLKIVSRLNLWLGRLRTDGASLVQLVKHEEQLDSILQQPFKE